MNPLRALRELGQSVWLDDIRRAWIRSSVLARWIAEDGLAGVTSNPAIFEKAIGGSTEYNAEIRRLARVGRDPGQIYEALALEDVGGAADLFLPLYRQEQADGFVSLEVSPHLADDTNGTLSEARRLWRALDRPNVMIKVPGTAAGIPAIRQLLAEGINVNVTLLFGVARYGEVVEGFLAAMEQRAAGNEPVAEVASVASFFVSRIDTWVDERLDRIASPASRHLSGQAAIACARLAYAKYRNWSRSPRWHRLAELGARPQRLLWASTSTKNPSYEDTKYVEALIGPDTVTTMPLVTFDAYRDHGRPALRLEAGRDDARAVVEALARLGVDLEQASRELEREGVRKFVQPFDELHATLARRVQELGAHA